MRSQSQGGFSSETDGDAANLRVSLASSFKRLQIGKQIPHIFSLQRVQQAVWHHASNRRRRTILSRGGFGPATEPRVTNAIAQTITLTILPSGTQKFYPLARP